MSEEPNERQRVLGRMLWETRFRTEENICGGPEPLEIARTIKRLEDQK